MEKIKKLLPAILMILFELAVGIMLLINPERFTIFVFIIFGSVLIICALVMLIRYLKDRKAAEKAALDARAKRKKKDKDDGEDKDDVKSEPANVSILPLIAAVLTFIIGAVFAFGSAALYNLTLLLVIFYGAIMIVKGIFKIADYISLRKEKAGVSVLRLVVGILSIVIGVIMMIFSSGAREAMFIIAAVSLLVEAVMDVVTLVLGYQISKQMEAAEKKKLAAKADDKPYDLENFE